MFLQWKTRLLEDEFVVSKMVIFHWTMIVGWKSTQFYED